MTPNILITNSLISISIIEIRLFDKRETTICEYPIYTQKVRDNYTIDMPAQLMRKIISLMLNVFQSSPMSNLHPLRIHHVDKMNSYLYNIS
jgi:hypothetical protein